MFLVSASVTAETLSYEVYELAKDGSRKLLVSDTRTYAVKKDVHVKDIRGTDGKHLWSKELALAKGFHVDVAVTRETSVDGFGLTFGNDHWPLNMSWNWFEEEQAENHVFKQLKADGRIRITTAKVAGEETEEIVAVDFLSDVTLTCLDNLLKADPKNPRDTHAIVVKQGSVLRVAE
jgi:hypothetical protein